MIHSNERIVKHKVGLLNLAEELETLQHDLDEWLLYYNVDRTYQGKMCCGCAPMETLEDGKKIWKEKFVN